MIPNSLGICYQIPKHKIRAHAGHKMEDIIAAQQQKW